MILSFANKETEEVFHGTHHDEILTLLPSNLLRIAEERLDLLNGTDTYQSLCLIPSIKLAISDHKQGKHSIPIRDHYRLHFRWDKEGPSEVEIRPLRKSS